MDIGDVFGLILAAIPAAMAFGTYRANAFFDWQYRWRTREEDPRYFWATIYAYVCVSLVFLALTLWQWG